MTTILIILSFGAFMLNLDAPPLVSNASTISLCIEHSLVLIISRLLINKVLGKENNSSTLNRYYQFFLIGLIISLLVLRFIWTPELNPNLDKWGYDPQRYYYYATQIVEGKNIFYSLNYQGVVYFYVVCMYIGGIDPLIPLYVNAILSLYATLLVIRVISGGQNVTKYVWLLLIPEIIRFNYEPSREILCMSGATIFIAKWIEIKFNRSFFDISIMILSFFLVAFIRPPMSFPIVIGIVIHSMLHTGFKKNLKNLIVLPVILLLLIFAMNISAELGSDFDQRTLTESVSKGISGQTGAREDAASSGMTVWLIPHNPIEYVVFGIIRSFVYIIPPPLLVTDFFNQFSFLKAGIYPNLTVLAMFFFIPSIWRGLRRFKKLPSRIQLIAIVLIAYFLTIGISLPNLIHQRYRLVYDLFYFAFAIYCWTHTRRWSLKMKIMKLTKRLKA